MLKKIRKSITAKFSTASQPQVNVTSPAEASSVFFGDAKQASSPLASVPVVREPSVISTPIANAIASATSDTDAKAVVSPAALPNKQPPPDQKISTVSSSITNTIKLKYTADDYLKDAKFKQTPGLLFKGMTPFKPLTIGEFIDEEVDDIQALAQRLWALRRTLDHDVHELQAPQSLATSSATTDSKAVAQRASLTRSQTTDLGKAWSKLDVSEKATLIPMLERLSYDERLMVLDILAEVDSLVSLQARARSGWLQLKTAVRLGGFAKKAKMLAATQAAGDVTVVSSDVLASSTTLVESRAQPTAMSSGAMLDIQRCYQQALLAYDRRNGWAKLEADKRFQPKEQKGQRGEKESKSTTDDKASKVVLPPAVEQLRQALGNWLGTDIGKVPLAMVQTRLAALQDYCRLSSRLSEGTVHFAHDIQLAKQVLAQFKAEAFKDDPAVVQSVCQLAAAQDPDVIRSLLSILIDSIKAASLLEAHVLEGLATVLHYARPEQIGLGDLHTVLKLLVERSSNLGSDLSESDILRLVQAIAAVLSSMALISQHRQVQFAAWQQTKQAQKAAESKANMGAETKSTQPTEPKTIATTSSSLAPSETKSVAPKTKDDSLLFRIKRRFDATKEAILGKIEEPQDYSGLATLSLTDYEALSLKLNGTLTAALGSRFDLAQLPLQNPDLAFALSLIRQALMRLAHQELSRSEKIIAGARQFFTLLESAKTAVTDFSLTALWEAGNHLVAFINMTPLGDKFKASWGGEEANPQPWFEQFLILKTLVASDQLPLLELQLVEGLVPLNYPLSQGVLQLFDRLVRSDSREHVREAALQFLNLLVNDQLWQWPQQPNFSVLQQRLKQRCDKEYPTESRLTVVLRLGQQVYQKQQAESQRRLRQARRQCQENDLRYQWHDYCVQQTRFAHQDKAWLQDDSRYVPALAKSRFDVVDEQAELFYPTVHNFLRSRQEAVPRPLLPPRPKLALREALTASPVETKAESRSETIVETKAETKALTVVTPTTKTQHAMLILGDAGTGKSLFLRRNHLMACARYFGRVFDQASSSALGSANYPLSVHVYLGQSPVEGPLEHYLSQQGFTEAQIRQLKEQAQLLIHLDGYDEWSSNGQNPWVFAPKTLGNWLSPRLQVMVSCRSQHLQSDSGYLEYFTPPSTKGRSGSYGVHRDATALTQWIITRLDMGGVERLTQYYVHDEQTQGKMPWEVARYLQQFHASGIHELVRTPIILLMALQVLPVLEKRHGKNATILRLDIYREFIGQYIDAQRNKKLERGALSLNGLTEAAHRYAEQLALALFTREKVSVTYQAPSPFSFATVTSNDWDRFFAPTSADRLLSETIPLRISVQRDAREGSSFAQYSFIHKSMLDYFTALGLYQAIEQLAKDLEETPPAPPQLALPANVSSALPLLLSVSSQATVTPDAFLTLAVQWQTSLRYASNKHQFETRQAEKRRATPWNARAINTEQLVIHFLKEILMDHERTWQADQSVKTPTADSQKTVSEQSATKSPRAQFGARLMKVVQASRDYPELAQASANAATLLNLFDFSLINQNWQGVQLPGADLSYSVLAHSDLSSANLRGTRLAHSVLYETNLRGADLRDVSWGEYPHIELKTEFQAVVQHPTEPWLAVAQNSRITLFHRDTGERIGKAINGREGTRIQALTFTPDGSCLLSVTINQVNKYPGRARLLEVLCWDISTRKLVGKPINFYTDDHAEGQCIAFSPNGALLATAGWDKMIRLWDLSNKKPLGKPMQGHKGRIRCIAFSPDSTRLASAGLWDNSVIHLWDVATQTLIGEPMVGHTHGINCIVFSPDGARLASGGLSYLELALGDLSGDKNDDHTIRLWDVATQMPIGKPMQGHTNQLNCITFSSDGARLASGSGDKTVRLWDVASQIQVGEVMTGHSGDVAQVAFTRDGTRLISTSSDLLGEKIIRVWDVSNQTPRDVVAMAGHTAGIHGLTFSHDGLLLATGGDDKTICLWQANSQTPLGSKMYGHTYEVTSLAFSFDDRYLASGGNDKTVRLWDVSNQTSPGVLEGGTESINSVAFHPKSMLLAAAGRDNTVRLWDTQSQMLVGESMHAEDDVLGINSLAFSPDGSYVASAAEEVVRLWDVTTQKPFGKVMGGILKADGSRLDKDRSMAAMWNPGNQAVLHDAEEAGLRGKVSGIAFTPDGSRLASAADAVLLWNVASQRPWGEPLRGHDEGREGRGGGVGSVVFNYNGSRLLSVGKNDGVVCLWALSADGFYTGGPILGWREGINKIAVAPRQGQRVVSGIKDAKSTPSNAELPSSAEDVFVLGDAAGTISFWGIADHDDRLRLIGMPKHNSMPLLFNGAQLSGCQMSAISKRLLEQHGGDVSEVVVDEAASSINSKPETKFVSEATGEVKATSNGVVMSTVQSSSLASTPSSFFTVSSSTKSDGKVEDKQAAANSLQAVPQKAPAQPELMVKPKLVEEKAVGPEVFQQGYQLYNQGQYQKALPYFQTAAKADYPPAYVYLGRMYEVGSGVVKDAKESTRWYVKAQQQEEWFVQQANTGDAAHQFYLAHYYEMAPGRMKDLIQAAVWYRRAAEQGHVIAQNNLGGCYENGRGVQQDDEEAVAWYQRVATQGCSVAQYNLGMFHQKGQSFMSDDKEAFAWFQRAAEGGHAIAQYVLGVNYNAGVGVTKDPIEAVAWFRRAAEQGHADAQNSLGRCYEDGQGVSKDLQQAKDWYEKAAVQGHEMANINFQKLLQESPDLVGSTTFLTSVGDAKPETKAMLSGVTVSATPVGSLVSVGSANFFVKRPADVKAQLLLRELYILVDHLYPLGDPNESERRIDYLTKLQPYQNRRATLSLADRQALHKLGKNLKNLNFQQLLEDDVEQGKQEVNIDLLEWEEANLVIDSSGSSVTKPDDKTQSGHMAEESFPVVHQPADGFWERELVVDQLPEDKSPGSQSFQKGYRFYFYDQHPKALPYFQKAAREDYPPACLYLGRMYEMGLGVAKDANEANRWYEKAQQHEQWFIQQANKGEAAYQFYLGRYYLMAAGTKKDPVQAAVWYRLAAKQGHATAQNNLAACYQNGLGVDQNYEEAVAWYTKSAKQNCAIAQFQLGVCYRDGIGIAQDEDQAFSWFFQAAMRGQAEAQCLLGHALEDPKKSVDWYHRAAKQGHAVAQVNLGLCYRDGNGVTKDLEAAFFWFRRAAEQGDLGAQNTLGLCYENGSGVKQDYKEALVWFQRAADQGYAFAQFNVGCCYAEGQGVNKDLKQAKYWYEKAAAQGHEGATLKLEEWVESNPELFEIGLPAPHSQLFGQSSVAVPKLPGPAVSNQSESVAVESSSITTQVSTL